jgi:hypothetical protein
LLRYMFVTKAHAPRSAISRSREIRRRILTLARHIPHRKTSGKIDELASRAASDQQFLIDPLVQQKSVARRGQHIMSEKAPHQLVIILHYRYRYGAVLRAASPRLALMRIWGMTIESNVRLFSGDRAEPRILGGRGAAHRRSWFGERGLS